MRQRARAIWQFVIAKKQMDVSFSFVCPVIDNEFRHNIVKVVCRSTCLSAHGSTDYSDNVMAKFMINCRTDT